MSDVAGIDCRVSDMAVFLGDPPRSAGRDQSCGTAVVPSARFVDRATAGVLQNSFHNEPLAALQ